MCDHTGCATVTRAALGKAVSDPCSSVENMNPRVSRSCVGCEATSRVNTDALLAREVGPVPDGRYPSRIESRWRED